MKAIVAGLIITKKMHLLISNLIFMIWTLFAWIVNK